MTKYSFEIQELTPEQMKRGAVQRSHCRRVTIRRVHSTGRYRVEACGDNFSTIEEDTDIRRAYIKFRTAVHKLEREARG